MAKSSTVGSRQRPSWLNEQERSNVLVIRFIVWVALTLGRPAARLLLHPICLYFCLFARKARRASRKFLAKALGRPPGWRDLYRHLHTFSATILDRVFLLNDRYSHFEVRVFGQPIVDEIMFRGEGCILLGAHLGSFEIIRSLGREARGLQVGLVMYEQNARKLNAVLAAINPNLPLQVISLGRLDAMLKVEQALARGAFIGILSDRNIAGEGTLAVDFLGEPADIPLGPFRLAALLDRPVVLMFGLYRGGNRYDIHFERLETDDPPAQARCLSEQRSQPRRRATEQALHRYVERLEHYCRLGPYNWFNFYDFWE